jgi:hypothetical protein
MKENRDFKGVWIPKEIWINTDLSIIEKVLLVEIDSLDKAMTYTTPDKVLQWVKVQILIGNPPWKSKRKKDKK